MATRCPDPEWYVYVQDINAREIEKFNVFRSYNFLNGCKKTFKKYQKDKVMTKDELSKEIKDWAMYSFWSKCEYEIVVSGWVSKGNERKIDVYDQLNMNWDSFFQYVYDHKAFFLRKVK